MKKRSMPMARGRVDRPQGLQWDLAPAALERWSPQIVAAATPNDNTISILDPIGADPWTGEGVTAKRITAALRSIGPDADVVVNINSPGGDLFEGMAIYNALREHKGQVTVKVLALAASAASIIAMAADDLQIARAGFMMIHNTWVVAMGNRNDLRDVADTLEPFDAAMADIYSARSGIDTKKIATMMDDETWINGSAAVDQGFADSLLPSDEVKKDKEARAGTVAAHLLDMTLARAGIPRPQRRQLLNDYRSGEPASPSADKSDDTQKAVAGKVTQKADDSAQTAATQGNELAAVFADFKLPTF